MVSNMLLVLLQVGCALGHVRLINDGAVTWAIRNARTPEGSGSMSVSGPCGGNLAFGANGVKEIAGSSEMSVKINYNGGHKSPSNEFHAVYKCSTTGPTQAEMKTIVDNTTLNDLMTLTLKSTTSPDPKTDKPNYIDASTGNSVTAGYVLVFDLPPQAVGKCSVSIVDQRDWGGCVDLEVGAPTTTPPPDAPPPPTPAPTPILKIDEVVGSYVTSPRYDSCASNFDTCCCLDAKFDIVKDQTSNTHVLKSMYSVNSTYTYNMSKMCTIMTGNTTGMITNSSQPNTFQAAAPIGMANEQQQFVFDIREGRVSFTNNAVDTPKFCDGFAYMWTDEVAKVDEARKNYTAALEKGRELETIAVADPTYDNLIALKRQLEIVNSTYSVLKESVKNATTSAAKKFGGNMTEINMTHSNFTTGATAVVGDVSENTGGSSSGATAGIVIGILLILVLIGLAVVFRKTIVEKFGDYTAAKPSKRFANVDVEKDGGHLVSEEDEVTEAPDTPRAHVRGPPPPRPPPSSETRSGVTENAAYKPVSPPQRPAPRMANNDAYVGMAPDHTTPQPAPRPRPAPRPTTAKRPAPPPRPAAF